MVPVNGVICPHYFHSTQQHSFIQQQHKLCVRWHHNISESTLSVACQSGAAPELGPPQRLEAV